MVGPSGTVTFLFTDVEGSTRLWDERPDAMRPALARHDAVLRAAIEGHGGYVFSTGGDGFGAAFARAGDALAAAVDAQTGLAAEPWPDEAPVRVRMGLHTGEVEERDGNYFGPAVNRAARLMALVGGGRIVCSLATEQLVRGCLPPEIELAPAGTVRLRGLSSPEQVFVVRGAGVAESGEPVPAAQLDRPLPKAITRLIGRADELGELNTMLLNAPLVTLTGVGGVGKTRLALECAEKAGAKFADAVVWVDLASVISGDDVVQAVADALRVPAQPHVALATSVCAALQGRHVLIVLDNCEHVRAAAAGFALAMVTQADGLRVLATSRERLGVEGELVLDVRPLPGGGLDAPAVELLVERIGIFDSRPLLENDGAALVDIATRLDGLPLALELAAARCRSLGVVEVADRLNDTFRLLADRRRPVDRHRTLDAALAWSYNLLDDTERSTLMRLSVFAAGFTLKSAERVAASGSPDPLTVDEAVASLVDKSLVARDGSRFRMLETTRHYAALRLADSGQQHAVERAHTHEVVEQVGTICEGLRGAEEVRWVDVLDADWPDIRAVVRRGFDSDDADTVTAVIAQLGMNILFRRPEAFAWAREAAARWGDRPSAYRAELLGAAAIVAYSLGESDTAVELADKAMAVSPSSGGGIDCLPEVAAMGAYYFAGQFDRALAIADETFAQVTDGTDPWKQAFAASAVAMTALGARPDRVRSAADRAVELASKSANTTAMAFALLMKAAALVGDDPERAVLLVDEVTSLAASTHNQFVLAFTSGVLAAAAVGSGRSSDEALWTCLGVADEFQRTGGTAHAWSGLWTVLPLLTGLGRQDEAALALGGCEASGIPKLAVQALPHELTELQAGRGPTRHQELRSLGATISLAELLRILTRQQPAPTPQ